MKANKVNINVIVNKARERMLKNDTREVEKAADKDDSRTAWQYINYMKEEKGQSRVYGS